MDPAGTRLGALARTVLQHAAKSLLLIADKPRDVLFCREQHVPDYVCGPPSSPAAQRRRRERRCQAVMMIDSEQPDLLAGLAGELDPLMRRIFNGQAAISTATDTPVRHRTRRPTRVDTTRPARDRRKTAPTPKQTRPVKISRLLPSRRQVPAPTDPPPGTGKRPAGRTPQETNPPGLVHQVPHSVSTTAPRHPHRVREAVLGCGFHRHVHATPITHGDGSTGRMPGSLRTT